MVYANAYEWGFIPDIDPKPKPFDPPEWYDPEEEEEDG